MEEKSSNAFSRTAKESEVADSVAIDKDAEIQALKLRVERLEAEKDILKKLQLTSPKSSIKVSVYS